MYQPKICPICGMEFIPKSAKQKYCKREITLKCKVCGKEYIGYCQPDNKTVCDNESCKKASGSAGCKNTDMSTKICRTCGREFTPNYAKQLDCNQDVTRICKVCGKQFITKCNKYNNISTCSEECKHKAQVESKLLFYKNQTRKCELCGNDFVPKTNTQRYCDSQHYRKCEVCGKLFPFDSRQQKDNWRRTCSSSCASKLHSMNNGMKNLDVQDRLREARYNGSSEQMIEYRKFLSDPINYLNSLGEKKTIFQLSKLFGLHTTTMGHYINKLSLQSFVSYEMSNMENDVVDFLKTMGIEFIRHDRNEIKPKELDIWIPENKIAIECNPTSSHNSSKPMYDSGEPMKYSYHQIKTNLCEEKGIRLIHIFGYEWNHKRSIIESIIRNALGKTENKIFARNCELKEVCYSDAKSFLVDNHRQGFANSSVRLGLYFEDELVSLMTFGSARRTIGVNKNAECWELVRFCNKLNTSVVGGASKLFKRFVAQFDPSDIISFSDRAHTTGNLYTTLGFSERGRSAPGYVWVNSNTDIAYNRVNAQKHNLKKFLNDDNIDLTKTEAQIMEEHGFVRVYDSGVITWQWNKPMK